MALVIADRVQDTTSTTGTGALTLDNSPPAGYQSFAAIGSGNTTYYSISGGSEWEVGIGTYNSAGPSLNRDTVLSSSNSGSLVNFSAGVKVVFVTYPAERSVNQDAAGNVNINITGNAATATKATNLNDGTAGAIPYQTASNVTAFLSSASGVLVGGNPPSFSTAPTLTGTNFTSIPNAALTNSSVTLGTTSVALGATATTLAGLTSVTLTQDPVSNLQAATKQYVDNLVAASIHYHSPVKYEAPAALTATYNNGSGGIGATLTNSGTLAAFAPDGVVADVNDRVLIYQQTDATQNGIYVVTTVGDGITPWVLTRSSDANTYGAGPTGLGEGSTFYVQAGNTGAGEVYTCTTTGTITFGTTAINFVQISSAQVYSAGTGLTLSGTVFSLTSPVATSLGGTGLTSFTAANRAIYSTSSSTLTAGILPVAAGGTGSGASYTDGQLLIGRTSDGELVKGTIASGGSGLTVTNAAGSITITNTAPDQTVTLTGGGTTVITGSYPNFNITSNDQYVGTVTSVSGTGTVNGLTLTGTVTSSGSLTLGGTLSVNLASADVTGTLPVANGGTGAATLTANAVLLGNGASALQTVAPGASGNVLTSNGTAWVSQAPAATLLGQTDSTTPSETSLGFEAGLNTTGANNTFVGYRAGKANTSGVNNVAVGNLALTTSTTAGGVTAVGNWALQLLTTGVGNVGIGASAARYVTDGTNNTAVGGGALGGNGSFNVSIGGNSGVGVTTGSNNVFVGYLASSTTTTGSNNIVIGYSAQPSSATVSNEVTLGNSSITKTRLFGQVDLLGSNVGTVTAVSASAIDCSAGNYFTKTATGALTWTVTNVPASRAYSFILELTNGGTGTQTWFSGIKWPGGTAPTLTASGVDMLGFITDDGGTTWRGVQLMKDSK